MARPRFLDPGRWDDRSPGLSTVDYWVPIAVPVLLACFLPLLLSVASGRMLSPVTAEWLSEYRTEQTATGYDALKPTLAAKLSRREGRPLTAETALPGHEPVKVDRDAELASANTFDDSLTDVLKAYADDYMEAYARDYAKDYVDRR